MKLTRIAKMCCNGKHCPSVFEADTGDFVIQGYKPSRETKQVLANGMGPGENATVLPKEFAHEIAALIANKGVKPPT